MTHLTVFEGSVPQLSSSDPIEIAKHLDEIDVLFERWEANQALGAIGSEADTIRVYQDSIDRLVNRYEFQSFDVVSLNQSHPDRESLRSKFLNEHTHSEFEVRFFVEGRGLFYLHPDERVFAILCEKGDLISVPPNVKHWFDMGDSPNFTCIRLFTDPAGWIAEFTGDAISDEYPKLERYLELC